jgi:hypothetical protein
MLIEWCKKRRKDKDNYHVHIGVLTDIEDMLPYKIKIIFLRGHDSQAWYGQGASNNMNKFDD